MSQEAGVVVVEWVRGDAVGDEVTKSTEAQVPWALRSLNPGFYSQ